MTDAIVENVLDLPARVLVDRIRRGSLTRRQVVTAYVDRARARDADLNAITVPLFDDGLDAARSATDGAGVLAGVPISIKEQFLVAGTPSTWGLAHRAAHRADREGTLVRRLRAAGAIPIAKTNVPQLLIIPEADNALYGRTNNPWNIDRTPGGSSGGEACLVAARGSAIGFGGDLGGSVRVPAHFCGVHGFAPSEGRLPLDDNPTDILPPTFGIEPRMGPIARHVDDLVLAMSALAPDGTDGGSNPDLPPIAIPQTLRGLRVGWYVDDGFFPASPAIRRAAAAAASALRHAGAEVVLFAPVGVAEAIRLFIALFGDGSALRAALGSEQPDPRIAGLIRMGSLPSPVRVVVRAGLGAAGQVRLAATIGAIAALRPERVESLLADLTTFRERFAMSMAAEGVDVLVCPPFATPAIHHGQGDRLSVWSAGSYSTLFSILGYPAGVVAASLVHEGEESDRSVGRDATERAAQRAEIGSAGLPVGVQVAARLGQDGVVLAVMSELEAFFREQTDYPSIPPPGSRPHD